MKWRELSYHGISCSPKQWGPSDHRPKLLTREEGYCKHFVTVTGSGIAQSTLCNIYHLGSTQNQLLLLVWKPRKKRSMRTLMFDSFSNLCTAQIQWGVVVVLLYDGHYLGCWECRGEVTEMTLTWWRVWVRVKFQRRWRGWGYRGRRRNTVNKKIASGKKIGSDEEGTKVLESACCGWGTSRWESHLSGGWKDMRCKSASLKCREYQVDIKARGKSGRFGRVQEGRRLRTWSMGERVDGQPRDSLGALLRAGDRRVMIWLTFFFKGSIRCHLHSSWREDGRKEGEGVLKGPMRVSRKEG